MDEPKNPAEGRVALLEAHVEALTQQNDDLLHEVVALRADLSTTTGLNERLFGHIIRIIGFIPKSPEEAMDLLTAGFDLAMEREDFKARQEKMRESYRERTLDALRRGREVCETKEEVHRIRREVESIEQAKEAVRDPGALDDRLDDAKLRLNRVAARLSFLQGDR